MEMVRGCSTNNSLGQDFYGVDAEAKQGNNLGYSLNSCLIWEILIGCFRFVVSRFLTLRLSLDLLTLRHFQA